MNISAKHKLVVKQVLCNNLMRGVNVCTCE